MNPPILPPRRPVPGQVAIRQHDPNAVPSQVPGQPAPIHPGMFNTDGWEEGTDAELAPSQPAMTPPVPPVPPMPPRSEFVPPPMVTKTDTPVASSQLTDAAVEADVNVSGPEQKPLENVRDAKYVRAPTHPDANYIRVDLPSLCVPYAFNAHPFKDINVRPFKVKDLSKIWRAMQEESFTLLVDALDNTVDIDIRQLTPEDFSFLMYWHRINSYPKSPYTIEWTSKYGNKNKHTVTATNLDIKTLELTPEEYAVYHEYGIRMPTVRDLEILKMEKLSPDQEYLWGRAQYLAGETVDEKLAALDEFPDLGIEEVIAEFRQRIGHGVKESVTVIDGKFDPKTAPKALREQAQKIKTFLEQESAQDVVMAAAPTLLAKIEEYEAEAKDIEAKMDRGEKVLPKEEEITLTLNAMRFFPFAK